MKHFLTASLLAICCTTAAAQVYKCQAPQGVVYSDIPCGDNATRVSNAAAPTAGQGSAIVQVEESACAQELTKHVTFKDPASVRVEAVTRVSPKSISYGSHRGTAKTHTVRANARNGFGGYAGAKLYLCHVSADEKTVLHIAPAGY